LLVWTSPLPQVLFRAFPLRPQSEKASDIFQRLLKCPLPCVSPPRVARFASKRFFLYVFFLVFKRLEFHAIFFPVPPLYPKRIGRWDFSFFCTRSRVLFLMETALSGPPFPAWFSKNRCFACPKPPRFVLFRFRVELLSFPFQGIFFLAPPPQCLLPSPGSPCLSDTPTLRFWGTPSELGRPSLVLRFQKVDGYPASFFQFYSFSPSLGY